MSRVIGNNCIRFKNLPEGEDCKIGSFYGDISCLKYNFWQLLFRSKHCITKSEIFVRYVKSLKFYNLEFFWRLLRGERCIMKGWSWRSIFKITFLTTFIFIIKLYDQIFIFGHLWAYLGLPGHKKGPLFRVAQGFAGGINRIYMCSTYLWGCKTIKTC